MSDGSQLRIIVSRDDIIIRIYADIHNEDAGYLEVSLSDLQALKVMTDIGENLYRKKVRGGRL